MFSSFFVFQPNTVASAMLVQGLVALICFSTIAFAEDVRPLAPSPPIPPQVVQAVPSGNPNVVSDAKILHMRKAVESLEAAELFREARKIRSMMPDGTEPPIAAPRFAPPSFGAARLNKAGGLEMMKVNVHLQTHVVTKEVIINGKKRRDAGTSTNSGICR